MIDTTEVSNLIRSGEQPPSVAGLATSPRKPTNSHTTIPSTISIDAHDDRRLNVVASPTHNNESQPKSTTTTSFEIDRVFAATSTQTEVFAEVAPLVQSLVDGFDVCIFAYGQTGSGKTHSMEGTQDDPGINQRALTLLFEKTKEKSAVGWKYRYGG